MYTDTKLFVRVCVRLWFLLTPGKSHQYLGVQGLLHRAGSAARRSGGGEGDGQDE